MIKSSSITLKKQIVQNNYHRWSRALKVISTASQEGRTAGCLRTHLKARQTRAVMSHEAVVSASSPTVHTDGRTEKGCEQWAARCWLFCLDLESLSDLEEQMVIVPGNDLQAVCHGHLCAAKLSELCGKLCPASGMILQAVRAIEHRAQWVTGCRVQGGTLYCKTRCPRSQWLLSQLEKWIMFISLQVHVQ